MKFTLAWLKDHLETTASLDEIVTTLTNLGLEVEAVDDPAQSRSQRPARGDPVVIGATEISNLAPIEGEPEIALEDGCLERIFD